MMTMMTMASGFMGAKAQWFFIYPMAGKPLAPLESPESFYGWRNFLK